MSGQPSGLGWLPDGRLLIVSMTDRRLLRRDGDNSSASLTVVADLADHLGPCYANDMVVDAAGRAYIGGFGFDLFGVGEEALAPARMVRVDPGGRVTVVAEDLFFPNGVVITGATSDVGGTLIVNETYGNRITAFDIGAEDGKLSDRRTWAEFGPAAVQNSDGKWTLSEAKAMPDGSCLDAEGMLWVADVLNARLIRVKEGGEIIEEIRAEEGTGAFYACALGGQDGKTLFAILTPSHLPADCKASKGGSIVAYRVDVGRAGRD